MKYIVKFPCFPYFWRYFVKTCSLSAFNFFSTVPSCSFEKCSSLMSSWPWIILLISTKFVYNLPRQHSLNIDRSNKRKWFYPKRKKKARSRQYPTEAIKDTDYADDLVLLANTPAQAESLQHSLEQAAGSISHYMNSIEFTCFKWKRAISTLSVSPLKLDQFTYLGSNISSTDSDINTFLVKVWTVIDIFINHMEVWSSLLLYGCTTWTLSKGREKKVRWELHKDAGYCFEQILEAIPNKTAAVQPLTSHLKNHPSKTNKTSRALQGKHAWTYKQCSSIDCFTHGTANQ